MLQAVRKAAPPSPSAVLPVTPEQLTLCLQHAGSFQELSQLCSAYAEVMKGGHLALAISRTARMHTTAGIDQPLLLLAQLTPRLLPCVQQLSLHDIADVVWSLGRMGFSCDPELLQQLTAAFFQRLRKQLAPQVGAGCRRVLSVHVLLDECQLQQPAAAFVSMAQETSWHLR